MSKPIISQNPINTCFAQKKSTALCSESVPMWSLECQHLAFDSNISHENCAKALWFAWNNRKQHVCLSKNRGVSPQIIHFNRIFHEINHPFWDNYPYYPLFLETSMCTFLSIVFLWTRFYVFFPTVCSFSHAQNNSNRH